jgi:hypothetical protein
VNRFWDKDLGGRGDESERKDDWSGSQTGLWMSQWETTGPGNNETVGQEVLKRRADTTNGLTYRLQAENSEYNKAP